MKGIKNDGDAEQAYQPDITFRKYVGEIRQQQEGHPFSKKIGKGVNTQRLYSRAFPVF
ncbi:MAG: hypothetical protein IPJ02_14555 [Chitinophagaceae bacterium]|nr:hypothetical protein [Chitinophagaceae bacterium]